MKRKLQVGAVTGAAVLALASPASAQDALSVEEVQMHLDNTFILIAAALVIFMQAGFALVECGLTRTKNAANIAMKNLMDFCIGALAFFAFGYAFAYGGGGGFIGGEMGYFLGGGIGDGFGIPGEANLTLGTDFLFQVAFAATAATIVSGVIAERTKFTAYLVSVAALAGVIYPIVIHWQWGGGWLSTLSTPFHDFAGSTLVHLTGAVAGLVGAIVVGPRIGKYGKDGKPKAILGHSLPLAMFGTIILFVGWFGFNGGSVLAADASIGDVALNTALAAAGGGFACTVVTWAVLGKPDVAMACNGLLGGLVGITASADQMSFVESAIIGLIAGALVVGSVLMFDRLKVDDAVGAISVHGTCGIWGTLAVGIFGDLAGGGQLVSQAIGVVAVIAFVGATSAILFLALKYTVGVRVSEDVELEGLDIHEHGAPGYGETPGIAGLGGVALAD